MDERTIYSDLHINGKDRTDTEQTVLDKIFNLPLHHYLSNNKSGFLITDHQDMLLWINESFFEHPFAGPEMKIMLGRPVSVGMNYIKEFVKYPESFISQIQALLKKREPHSGIKLPLVNNFLLEMDYIPIYRERQFCGAVWQLRPGTGSKWQQSNDLIHPNESFNQTLDKFNLSYCELTKDGGVIRMSPFLCKLIGYDQEELQTINFLDLSLRGKEILTGCILGRHCKGLAHRKMCSFELEINGREGVKWVQCHAFCGDDKVKTPSGCMLFMTEISEQKNIQHELESAKKTAEDSQVAQQQFLASIAHDIRTPLNAIIGMTLLMANTALDKDQQEYTKVLKNASNILLDLLNGVLDFAKIESGKQEVRKKEFDLPGLLRALLDTLSFKLSNKQIAHRCDIDPEITNLIVGDQVLLNQILMNLLANAEKFTDKGEINLKATIVKTFENTVWIEFSVVDTGIGISKEDVEKIFQDFMQVDEDIQLRYGGSGLGLFICKRLVEMMGGQVTVESTLGKGTKFKFSLPFDMTDKPIEQAKDRLPTDEFSIKADTCILVVEDNPMNLKYLASLLEMNQVPFDTAMDGAEALDYAKKKYYNLILMDMKLPEIGGLEVTATIRQTQNPNAATPIILLSASTIQGTIDQAQKAGVNDLLTKPYTPDQLLDMLKKYLNEDESEDDLAEQKEDVFVFNKKLDTAYLQKLYSGNSNYALSLFDIFLECTEGDWAEIQQMIKNSEWEKLKDQVHKIKPNFSMVGLTWITKMAQDAYDELKEKNEDAAVKNLQEIQTELDKFMPLIKKEYQRMQKFLLHRKFPK